MTHQYLPSLSNSALQLLGKATSRLLLEASGCHVLIHLLETHELLEDVLEDVLCVAALPQLGSHAQDLAGLPDVEIQVLILTLVRELSQANPRGGELLVQIEEIE